MEGTAVFHYFLVFESDFDSFLILLLIYPPTGIYTFGDTRRYTYKLADYIFHCMYTSSITMGERTALSLNTKNKASLKTTVPMFIVKQWGLKAGEEVEWTLEVCKDGELIAAVT